MVPYVRDQGAIRGYTPRAERPAVPKPRAFPEVHQADPHWRDHAACLNEDPELFQPVGNTGPALLQIEDAKAVCSRCPAMLACRSWAMEAGIEHGVLGGMSEEERKGAKDERKAAKRRADRQQARMGGLS